VSILRPDRSARIGVAVAALTMLALMVVVSIVVVRWCPRGEDCKEASLVLFGLGMLVSFGASVAAGFVARDITDRFTVQPPR
jgi:hypothetical protein